MKYKVTENLPSGTPLHVKINGESYWNISWWRNMEDAERDIFNSPSAHIVMGSPWGYPNLTVYMVFVPDSSELGQRISDELMVEPIETAMKEGLQK